MAEMSAYCKAYYVKKLREFSDWKEDTKNLRLETSQLDGKEITAPKTSLREDDILYLHDSYIVADGIFKDENIVFDRVTDAWKDFCRTVLNFQIPVREPKKTQDVAPDTVETSRS